MRLTSVAESDAHPTCYQEVVGLISAGLRQHPFVENDQEIFSAVILFLQLIHEGQLSVSGKRMCTSTG